MLNENQGLIDLAKEEGKPAVVAALEIVREKITKDFDKMKNKRVH